MAKFENMESVEEKWIDVLFSIYSNNFYLHRVE